jgi:hypothetical protein
LRVFAPNALRRDITETKRPSRDEWAVAMLQGITGLPLRTIQPLQLPASEAMVEL